MDTTASSLRIDKVEQEVLDMKGLGEFGDEFIVIPVQDKQIKMGVFNTKDDPESDHDEDDEKSDAQDTDDDEPALLDERRQKIENVVNYMCDKDNAPWIDSSQLSQDVWVRLHNEIIQYYQYFGPSKKRDELGTKFFMRVSHMVGQWNPNARVELYGSWATRSYSPNSVMDVTVLFPPNPYHKKHAINQHLIDKIGEEQIYVEREIQKIYSALALSEEFQKVTLVKNGKVQIIKLLDKSGDVAMKIEFNRCEGLASLQFIRKFMVLYPEMKYFILILKEFLDSRGLNDVKTGGLSPYWLILLLISYFQDIKKEEKNANLLLSEHLLNIMTLYGGRFDYKILGVSIRCGGFYFSREDKGWNDKSEDALTNLSLSLENPLDISVDLGKEIKLMKQVQVAFSYGFDGIRYDTKQQKSLLKCILLSSFKSV